MIPGRKTRTVRPATGRRHGARSANISTPGPSAAGGRDWYAGVLVGLIIAIGLWITGSVLSEIAW